jgi:hypothetical protein
MNRHREASSLIAARPEDLFAHLDDQTRLAKHMGQSSMMMGGGRMTYAFDAQAGRAVGSHIRMGGRAFGLELDLDEVVTEREPPRRKVWRTVGTPRLVIIGRYQMGFEIDPVEAAARLRVWIDYDLPHSGFGRFTPALADLYARWCVQQMVRDAAGQFAPDRLVASGSVRA